MTKNSLRIVFMGTPEFAVASLQKLVESGALIVAVVTAPDKPMGRGKKIGSSPVKEYAVSQKLPVLQPTNLKSPEFLKELAEYNADLQIVVAFRMLPESVWDMPPMGTFNLHASLLPSYRGAAPINWAIINGEKETGVTTFKLKHEIDTGNILFQEKEPISEKDTAGSLYDRLMWKGADLVVKTTKAIQGDNFELSPQTEVANAKNAPKIFKEDCKVNWNRPVVELQNFIRGLNPYPTAWTNMDGQTLKIYEAEPVPRSYDQPAGSFVSDGKSYLDVVTSDGVLTLKEVQLQGKKRMPILDFLRGYHWNTLH